MCRKFLLDAPGEENPIAQIFDLLKSAGTLELDGNNAADRLMVVDSLENIANRCSMAEQNSTVMDFVFMINTIQLRCKVIRLFSQIIYLTCSDQVLNLAFVKPTNGRRLLSLNRSRA